VILLNFDGSRYSVGDFRNFRWSQITAPALVVKLVSFLSFSVPLHQMCQMCARAIIWRNSLLAIWRKAWVCRSWRSCRQRLGILRYHASGCLDHTFSSIDRRRRCGSSLSDRAPFVAVTPNSEQRFAPHTALTYSRSQQEVELRWPIFFEGASEKWRHPHERGHLVDKGQFFHERLKDWHARGPLAWDRASEVVRMETVCTFEFLRSPNPWCSGLSFER
jgi:hypothetical protein